MLLVAGNHGAKQVDLLWTPTIISTIKKVIICAENVVIQAPIDGSAPNLVILDYNKQGQPYYKRAFNTQACEQLINLADITLQYNNDFESTHVRTDTAQSVWTSMDFVQ